MASPARRALGWIGVTVVIAVALIGARSWLVKTYQTYRADRATAALYRTANDLPYRTVEGRLHGDFTYKPLRPVRRGGDATEPLSAAELTLSAARHQVRAVFASRADRSEGARPIAAAELLDGDVNRALSLLERWLAPDAPEGMAVPERIERCEDAALLSDLAAAYQLRADRFRRPEDRMSAVAAANRAWRLKPASPEVLWNRALAIEGMGLMQEARDAWDGYLQVDATSAWSREARDRQAALALARDADLWKKTLESLDRHAGEGDEAFVRGVARRFPVRMKERVEREWITEWAAAVERDPRAAERLFRSITAAGDAIAKATQDRTVADLAGAARAAGDLRRFAAAHARASQIRVVLRRDGPIAATKEWEAVIEGLSRAGSPMAAVLAVELGGWHYERGRHEAALTVLDRVEPEIAAHPWPLTAAKEAWNRGVALTSLGHVTRAAVSYARAGEIYRTANDATHAGMIEMLLGDNAQLANDPSRQWPRFLQGLHLAERHGDPQRLLVVLDTFVRAAFREGHIGAASFLNGVLIARATESAALPYLCHARITQCEIEVRAGRRAEGAVQCAAARQTWAGIADEAARERLDADLSIATAATSSGALRIEHLTRAFDRADARRDLYRLSRILLLRGRAYTESDATALARADLERGLEEIEEQRQRLEAIPDRVTYMETSRGLAKELVRLLVRSGEGDAALGVVERVRARTLTERLTGSGHAPVDPRTLARRLGSSEAIVEYWSDDRELYIWVLRRDRVHFVRSPIERALLREHARRFSGSLESGERADDDASSALYAAAIAPIASTLEGVTHVVIVADEVLAAVPFSALRENDGPYLLERFTLAGAASGAALMAARDLRISSRSSVVMLANPVVRQPLPALDVRAELAAVRRLAAASVYERQNATLAVLRKSAPRSDVLHIATHGFEDAYSGEPGVAFTPDDEHDDGLLLASEAEDLELRRGSLVILAACRTARGKSSFEGSLSLARAFLAAGAGAVIATLWDVEDQASGAIFSDFYAALGTGAGAADALRSAQLSMLKREGRSRPPRWAAYQVEGGME